MTPYFDAVLIGRNEGARLERTLRAALSQARRVVYVDSGSSDGSADMARALGGVVVVDLDPAYPFTAARGRNEGFAALGADRAEFVQFLDGDCILHPDWPGTALDFLRRTPMAGLIHGHTAEEHPDASIYVWMTDKEWKKPAGPDATGIGTFMIRGDIYAQTGGMRPDMIAAEDDEFFARVRAAGWQTWCLPRPMALHDVGITTFGPWFRRAIRAGHSFAELDALHPGLARRSVLRALFWAGLMPLLALAGLLAAPWLTALVLLVYGAQILRASLRQIAAGDDARHALHANLLLMVGKFANLYGLALYVLRRLRRSRAQIIEYKPGGQSES